MLPETEKNVVVDGKGSKFPEDCLRIEGVWR